VRNDQNEPIIYEEGPLICRQCGKHIEPFFIENINQLIQLRAGSAIIHETILGCLHCGALLTWNPKRTKVLLEMTEVYRDILGILHGGQVEGQTSIREI